MMLRRRVRLSLGIVALAWLSAGAPAWAARILPSGYIPPACRHLSLQDPFLLDCWLKQYPEVGQAIKWEIRHAVTRDWFKWEPWRKRDLRRAFQEAREWHAGGMQDWGGLPVEDPPPNVELLYGPDPSNTVLDSATAAWPLYVAHVAFSLAAEIDAWVPWSIRNYLGTVPSPETPVLHLLSPWPGGGAGMFKRDSDLGDSNDTQHPHGYIVRNGSTPAHPTLTFKFLADHDLIGATPVETIGRVLDWSRSNLNHYVGAPSLDNLEAHWQYRGLPPVSRVLEGTVRIHPDGTPEIAAKHWTAGCWGTSGFYTWLFRVVNIPVQRAVVPISGCGHQMPYFSGAKLYLSHGDDPYSALSRARTTPGGPFYDASLLLISPTTWNSLFTGPQAGCHNVGRRAVQLALTYPDSVALVGKYCEDVKAGKSHADGKVYEIFKPYYSVGALESRGLWTRLAALVPTTTAFQCAGLQ